MSEQPEREVAYFSAVAGGPSIVTHIPCGKKIGRIYGVKRGERAVWRYAAPDGISVRSAAAAHAHTPKGAETALLARHECPKKEQQ